MIFHYKYIGLNREIQLPFYPFGLKGIMGYDF